MSMHKSYQLLVLMAHVPERREKFNIDEFIACLSVYHAITAHRAYGKDRNGKRKRKRKTETETENGNGKRKRKIGNEMEALARGLV